MRPVRVEAAEGKLGNVAQLTLDLAAGKWWAEVGQHRGDSDLERQKNRLQRLVKLFPKDIRLAEITTATVSDAIQKRKGITFKRGKDKRDDDGKLVKAKEYAVSNATVNRDVIGCLRPILRRATRIWGAKGLPGIALDELALPTGRPATGLSWRWLDWSARSNKTISMTSERCSKPSLSTSAAGRRTLRSAMPAANPALNRCHIQTIWR